MHVDHNMHVIGCNMHITCTLFRIGNDFKKAVKGRRTLLKMGVIEHPQNTLTNACESLKRVLCNII